MRLLQSKPHLGVVLLGSWLIATGILYLVGRARELSIVPPELAGTWWSITSTLAGVLLLGAIFNVFNLGGTINSYWQWVLRGIFLLAVVVLQGRLTFVQGDPHAGRES